MSTFESEHGMIFLPSAAFSKVRKAMELEDKRLKEHALEFAQTLWAETAPKVKKDSRMFWNEIRKRSGNSYIDRTPVPAELRAKRLSTQEIDAVVELAHDVLRQAEYRGGKPSRPQKQFMSMPTNKTTSFIFEEAEVFFNKEQNLVEWRVSENNHSVDRAHSDPRFEVLEQQLKAVRWTRNTGGTVYYQNEYQSGGESPSRAYGPNGATSHPMSCIPYTMANGQRVTDHDLREIAEKKFQAASKAFKSTNSIANGNSPQPRGHNGHAGQYTYRTHGASDVWL